MMWEFWKQGGSKNKTYMRNQLPENKTDILHLDWGFIDESIDPTILSRSLRDALKKKKFTILQYGNSLGLLELRNLILSLLKERFGIRNVTIDNICITSGATAAIDLVSRLILQKKYDVAVFEPTFDTAIESLLLNSRKIHSIEFDPFSKARFDLNKLEKILTRKKTKLLYINPNFQNPTGVTVDLATRKKILTLCRVNNVYLLEDDPYKLYNFDNIILPENFINLDKNKHNTLYINSLSKISFPGLRIGMIIGDNNKIKQIAKIQKYTISSPNLITQGIAAELLKDNTIDKCINAYYDNIKKKRNLLLKYIRKYKLANYIDYTRPAGGFYFWGRIKNGRSSESLLLHAKQKGVFFAPGSIYFIEKNRLTFFRIAYSQIKMADVKSAVLALKNAVEEIR